MPNLQKIAPAKKRPQKIKKLKNVKIAKFAKKLPPQKNQWKKIKRLKNFKKYQKVKEHKICANHPCKKWTKKRLKDKVNTKNLTHFENGNNYTNLSGNE